jgi:hypothetical protein
MAAQGPSGPPLDPWTVAAPRSSAWMEFKASHQFSCLHGQVNGKTADFRPAVARILPGPAACRDPPGFSPNTILLGSRSWGAPCEGPRRRPSRGVQRRHRLKCTFFHVFFHGLRLSEFRVIGVNQRRLSRPRQGGRDCRLETWPVGVNGRSGGGRLPGFPGLKSSLQGAEAGDRTTQEFKRCPSIEELARNGVALKQDLYGQLSSNLGIFHRDVSVRAHAGYRG